MLHEVALMSYHLLEQVSIWYGAILRGDLNAIRINCYSNVQDKTVIHAARCKFLMIYPPMHALIQLWDTLVFLLGLMW